MSEHIAILGGSFAGLTAAIKLSKRHAVTVISLALSATHCRVAALPT